MTDLADAAESLARHHRSQESAAADEVRSLVNYAEAPQAGDWTLRSALVRLAQPHPRRAEAVLELVRRLDAVLGPMAREIQRHSTITRRLLPRPGGAEPVPDARVVDIALLIEGRPADAAAAIDGYERITELADIEKEAIPLLVGALVFDELAGTLAEWAAHGSADPPIIAIDSACRRLLALLESIGVPVEEPPARFTRTRS